MTEARVERSAAFAFTAILAIVLALFAVSFLTSTVLGLPTSLSLPAAVELLGGVVVAGGVALAAWVFRYRSPANMIVSTYVTLAKLIGRIPMAEKAERTEPLVVSGPQKYVRNPLYLAVIVMVFGWALLTAYTFILVASVVLLLWFSLVLIPFEERELRVLFGDQWKKYSDETPALIPFTKRRRD